MGLLLEATCRSRLMETLCLHVVSKVSLDFISQSLEDREWGV